MTFLIDNWYLIVTALVSGGLLLWPVISRGGLGAGGVDAAEAVRLINREKAVVLDVSEPAEYAQGHLAQARNVPFGTLESGAKLPPNKAVPVIVVCPTGARAGRAVGVLRKLGYEKARVLTGGLKAWQDASLPVEKSA